MDYKKKYKDALERARNLHKDAIDMEDSLRAKMAEIIFPELKESEDEKIKKWIIDDIRYNINNEPLNNSEYKKEAEKAIAWLEKQGENADVMLAEMRGEEWSEEDDVAVKDICDKLNRLSMTYVGNESIVCQEEINWLKSIKERMS